MGSTFFIFITLASARFHNYTLLMNIMQYVFEFFLCRCYRPQGWENRKKADTKLVCKAVFVWFSILSGHPMWKTGQKQSYKPA
jgi:hypothetical protein